MHEMHQNVLVGDMDLKIASLNKKDGRPGLSVIPTVAAQFQNFIKIVLILLRRFSWLLL